MKFAADGPMALPLWINGHAFLTVAEQFFDVVDAVSGEPLRRTPLCGRDEVAEATAAAVNAQTAWAALPCEGRQQVLQSMAQLLDQYTGHFAKLLTQETGLDTEAARAAVERAVAALRHPSIVPAGVVGVIADAAAFVDAVTLVAAILHAGGAVVVKPSPKAPGALFAMAELSARAGLLPGVLNLVHGDIAVIDAMGADARIERFAVCGADEFTQQVGALLAKHRQQ